MLLLLLLFLLRGLVTLQQQREKTDVTEPQLRPWRRVASRRVRALDRLEEGEEGEKSDQSDVDERFT